MMDWFLVTCGGAAVYAAGRWLQSRLQGRRDRACLSGNQRRGIPLKAVVANCEAKWFLQELQQAMSGDHTAMVRVSHMLLVGYGTRQDEAAAASWMRKAWALQNFKEPADPYLQYDMLDLRNSDIPVLNDDLEPAAAAAASETQSTQHNTAAAMAAAAGEAAQAAGSLRRRTRQSSNSSQRHSGTQEAAPSVLPGHGQAAAGPAGAGAGVPDAPVGIRAQPVLNAGCRSSDSSGADSTGVQAGAGGGQGSRSGSSNRTAGSAAQQHAAAVQDEALASQALQRQQLQQHSLQHQQQQQQQPPLLPLVKAAEQATVQTVLQLPQATVAMPAAVMVVQQQLAAMAADGRPAAGQDHQQGSLAEQWPQLSAQLLSSCAP